MKTNQLKIGVILSYLTMVCQNIISIIYTPIMLRLLGQSEYGLYQLVSSVVSYLGLLSFGFGSSYVRFYSRYKVNNDNDGIKKLNGMFLTFFLVISIVTLLCGSFLITNIEFVLGSNLSPNEINISKILMSIMIINMAITFPLSVFDCYLTAHEEYFVQKVISLSQVLLNPFLTLPLLLMGYKSIAVVSISLFLTIIKLIFCVVYCKRNLGISFDFKGFKYDLLSEVWIFSFFIFLNMIIDQVNWNIDKLLLGRYGGTDVVAVYSIASTINSLCMTLSNNICTVFFPRINRMVSEGNKENEINILFAKVGRIQFMILAIVLSGFILLGKYFVTVWAGSEYEIAYWIALWLMIPITVPLIQSLGIEIQRAKNMHRFRSHIYLLVAILNVFISIPLIKLFGGIGAAMGTAISLILGNILIMNWYYQCKIKLDMFFYWKEICKLLPSFILSFCIGFVLVFIIPVNNIKNFIIVGIFYVVVYLVIVYRFGMNDYEKSQILSILHKVKGKVFLND